MKAFYTPSWGSVSVSVQELSVTDRVFVAAALIATLALAFPHLSAAQVADQMPFVVEINNSTSLPSYLATGVLGSETDPEALAKILPLSGGVVADPRVPILAAYLKDKRSPMAEQAKAILEQNNYRLLLGISFAESNFCKYQIRTYNCWGIGGTNPEAYHTYAEAFARADELIQKYQDSGLVTPQQMRNRWVGWQNHSWPIAVSQVVSDLETIGL